MRHPLLAVFSIALILLSACGKEYSATTNKMSEEQAMSELSNIPMQAGRGALGKSKVSVEALITLLKELIASGKIKVPARHRTAVNSSGVDLSTLSNIFSILQGGNGIGGLATGLINSAGGSATKARLDITSIIEILNLALPIILVAAPQFAGIVQALVVILPIVVMFINMFKKPTPPPTAWNFIMAPTLA